MIDQLYAGEYALARLLFQRGLALIYLIAFTSSALQGRGLLGEEGLLPVPRYLRRVSFREAPSIFHLYYSDQFFLGIAWSGAAISVVALTGLSELGSVWLSLVTWLALWVLYQSIVNVGQSFYAFGWESLLLEAGFFAVFLGPAEWAPSLLLILMLRWILFRVEFGAGLIKLRGDECWRDLTCLNYHYETQPLPNPVSWYVHHAPVRFHRLSVLGNHFFQLVVPWGLFLPQPIPAVSGALIIMSQAWLILTGNFSWLNHITIVLAFTTFPDSLLSALLPLAAPELAGRPLAFEVLIGVLVATTIVLSWYPIRNMISSGQFMNYSFNPLHLVNTYGAFGSITKRRFEVIVEGTDADRITETTEWREYEFKAKPGDPQRRPPFVAPYHLRLDWLMWFLPFSPGRRPAWFSAFVGGLLRNQPQILDLVEHNPFPGSPPQYVRARFVEYQFTEPQEKAETGAWWSRREAGEFLPAVRASE